LSKYIVDANIYASIIVKDEFHRKAAEFLKNHGPNELITVDLAILESLNTLWKHTQKYRRIPLEKYIELAGLTIKIINNSTSEIIPSTQLLDRAITLSKEYEITIYDSIYLAAAEKHRAKLTTLDKKLIKTLESKGYKETHSL